MPAIDDAPLGEAAIRVPPIHGREGLGDPDVAGDGPAARSGKSSGTPVGPNTVQFSREAELFLLPPCDDSMIPLCAYEPASR